MADGIPYFPLDVTVDDKIELIEAEFGLKGFAVIVKLYQKIYGGLGYYCEWTNDVGMLFSRKIGEGYTSVSEIVSAAIRRGIFDSDLYEKYHILTSTGIQKRYFSAVSRRKQINVKGEYLLVKVEQFSENVNILSENVNKNNENVCNFEQSKEEKSKVKNSIVKKRKVKNTDQLTDNQTNSDACLRAYEKYIGLVTPSIIEGIEFYLSQGMEAALIIRIIEYVTEQSGSKRSWQYLNAALLGNLNDGIKTLDEYNRAKADREQQRLSGQGKSKTKVSKFNNYDDANKGDYADLEDDILDRMLSDDY